MLRISRPLLVVTVATLVLTMFLYIIVPKGFFPVQDTGRDPGHFGSGRNRFRFRAMAERQQALAKVILKDPDVVSLSSFIGVDGTNMTPNSGRIQINLKPRDERKIERHGRIIGACSRSLRRWRASRLYMQPVQDLTRRGSRQPHAVSVHAGGRGREGAGDMGCRSWWIEAASTLPQLRDVASDQQNDGLEANLVIDRDTASRLGISPQAIDDTLYDAFGQRQVSTMFTQLNQYHVVLEVEPEFQQNPDELKIFVRASAVGRRRCR